MVSRHGAVACTGFGAYGGHSGGLVAKSVYALVGLRERCGTGFPGVNGGGLIGTVRVLSVIAERAHPLVRSCRSRPDEVVLAPY